MSASRHRRKPRLKLELCVQPCVRAVRASLRSCAAAGRRPRRRAGHPETQGAVLSAPRQRPPRGEAVRSYSTARFLVNQWVPVRTNTLQHIKSVAASAMDLQAGRLAARPRPHSATPECAACTQRSALTASHGAAWRQRWIECFELPPAC